MRLRELLPRGYSFTVVGIAVGVAGLVSLGAMAERITRFLEGGDRFVLGQISVAGEGMGMGTGFTAGGLLSAAKIREIAAVVRQYDDTLLLVDSVSGFLGMELRVDDWGIDFALTSSQKAFGLPPGIAFAACSDRVLERAKQVKNRGYYFDFIEIDALAQKNNTPSTPPVDAVARPDGALFRHPRSLCRNAGVQAPGG